MKKIPLTQGQFAIVDDEDFEELSKYKWCAHKPTTGGYVAMRGGKDGTKYMHQTIMGLQKGNKMQVDHINHDTLDNRRSKLRVCTRSQNCMNKSKQSNNTSGYKGVSWYKAYKKWRSTIQLNRKQIHLGYYDSKVDAAKAYNKAAIKYHGEFAYLNDI